MRIIAGKHRGRPLAAPEDDTVTRPITDRVKESIFNSLMARGLLGGGYVADIFAGVGSLGIETLSRGAEHCTFVERHRAIRALLETNIATMHEKDNATVLPVDAMLTNLPAMLIRQPLRVIFLDPPYQLSAEAASHQGLEQLMARLAPLMEPEGMIIIRSEQPNVFGSIEGLHEPWTEHFGKMNVQWYERPGEGDEPTQTTDDAEDMGD